MATYKECRALTRGLEVLQSMNVYQSATPSLLAAETGIHRTTVHRLLETLRKSGFVEKSPEDDAYRLTIKSRTLSEGYTDDMIVARVAAPILKTLQEKIVWPSDLSVLNGDVMLIRESTHRFSPFSVHRAMVGRTWPVMASACGRAQLCFRSEAERESLLRLLARSGYEGNEAARNREFVDGLVARVRSRGYAESVGELEENISAIAIPVRVGARVAASLSMIFFASAMTPEEAAGRYLGPLYDAAEEIARASLDGRAAPENSSQAG